MKFEGTEPVEILQKLIELKPPEPMFEEDQDKDTCSNVEVPKNNLIAKILNKHIRCLIKHPLFEKYNLTHPDVMVIADLWHYHLELPGRGSSLSSICFSAKIKRHRISECFDYLTSLLERNIICFDEKITGNYYLNPLILQSAEFTLSKEITLRILGRDLYADLDLCMKEEWQDNDDFLSDLRLIFDLCYHSFGELGNRSPVLEYPILSSCLNLMKLRILSAPDTLGIKSLVNKHSLSESQLYIILVVMYHQLCCDDRITEQDLVLSLTPDPRLRWLQQNLVSDDSVLISEGIVSKEQRFHRAQVSTLGIPHEMLKSLGFRTRCFDDAKPSNLSSFFQKCQPRQTLNDLIIPEVDKKLLTHTISKCKKDTRMDLEKWGLRNEQNKQGVVLLLYGAPGTGKTYSAGAIANELKRELLMLNVPELRNKYYGETEKLIKKAFCQMREMATDNVNSPVFLLNEADQLIHHRTDSTSTCGTIENTIQSIILEELETFPGILILTTNLESHMDEAFFRRFDLKFKFNMPDIECRRKLWKMYLRKEIPGSGDIDVELWAKDFISVAHR